MKPNITTTTNNFRIITDTIENVNSVVLNVWVNVGSRFEHAKNMGISHFLEHMAFKGTKTRTALDIAQIFDNIGGNLNAYTSRETTVYHVKVLKNDIKIALEVLADIIINSQFPESEIEQEKNVILQEIYQTNDSPEDIIFDKYLETAYCNQALGHSILGTPEIVKGFTRNDTFDYVNKHYFAENMLLSVSGNISHEDIVSYASPIFSQIKNSQKPGFIPANYTGGEYVEARDLDQIQIILGFPGYSYHDENYHVMKIISAILGGGMSSRLFQEVREKRGLAYSIYSFTSSYYDTGMFSIYSGTNSENLENLLKIVADEIKKFAIDLNVDEFERTKKRIESELLMSRESNYSRASAIGSCYTRFGRFVPIEEIINKFKNTTITDVKNCMEKIISNYDKITVAAIGILDNLPSYDKIREMLRV